MKGVYCAAWQAFVDVSGGPHASQYSYCSYSQDTKMDWLHNGRLWFQLVDMSPTCISLSCWPNSHVCSPLFLLLPPLNVPSGFLAHGPLSCEPPPGHLKLREAGLCAMHTHVTGTAPSAYMATHRPRDLIGGQCSGQSETCSWEAEAREGGEFTVDTGFMMIRFP